MNEALSEMRGFFQKKVVGLALAGLLMSGPVVSAEDAETITSGSLSMLLSFFDCMYAEYTHGYRICKNEFDKEGKEDLLTALSTLKSMLAEAYGPLPKLERNLVNERKSLLHSWKGGSGCMLRKSFTKGELGISGLKACLEGLEAGEVKVDLLRHVIPDKANFPFAP